MNTLKSILRRRVANGKPLSCPLGLKLIISSRRSDSIISATTEGDSRPGSPPSRKAKGKRASKCVSLLLFSLYRPDDAARRARFSTDGDEDDDDESTPKGSPTPEAPKRTLPKRAAYVIFVAFNRPYVDDRVRLVVPRKSRWSPSI